MKILSIPATHGLLKPTIGAQNRFFNLMKCLMESHQIILLESRDFLVLKEYYLCRMYSYNELKFFGRTLTILRDLNFDFLLKVFKILKKENIDMVQVTHPSGIIIIKIASFFSRKKVIIVYDAYDVQSNFIKEVFADDLDYNKLERIFVQKYIGFLETVACKYCVDYVTSVSEDEKDIFISKYGLDKEKVSVIPSGCNIIDMSPFKEKKYNIKERLGINPGDIVIFFHGAYAHPANREAIEIIEKDISPRFKDFKNCIFLIGGFDVPEFEYSNIKSIGYIENMYEVLSIVDIAIVPLVRGAGTKLKIFDYLGAGIPIITTKKGAEGIKIHNFKDALIVNGIEDFYDAITYFITDEKLRNALGDNARKLAEKEYNWIKIGRKLTKTYEIIGSKTYADE